MKRIWACLLATIMVAAPVAVRADIFQLATGGQIEGQLLNPDETPRTKYVVRTASGGQVTLAREQVKEVLRPKPDEIEFARIQHQYPDTVQGQWDLSQWCREHGFADPMRDPRQAILERIIELDPDHSGARTLLGYSHIDGKWKTPEQILAERGLVKYKGRPMTPQEVQIIKEREAAEQAQAAWFSNLRLWRGWLDDPGRHEEAKNKFLGITDAAAVPGLKQMLEDQPDDPTAEAMKLLLVDSLAHIGTSPALKVLAQTALADPNEEIRLSCLDHLQQNPLPEIVSFFVQKLKDKDNNVVNRAGKALGVLKQSSTIPPLIDALVTKHKFAIVTGNPGGMSVGMGSGGTGFSTGGGPQIITQQMNNFAVLDALVGITGGVNFGYDVAAWKRWLSTQRPSGPTSIRRD